jgi:hypothetical protein
MVDRQKYPYEARGNRDGERVYLCELQVRRSAAGYYVGPECWVEDRHGGYPEPGSRESGYSASREAAQRDLDSGVFTERKAIENEHMYEAMGIPRRGGAEQARARVTAREFGGRER